MKLKGRSDKFKNDLTLDAKILFSRRALCKTVIITEHVYEFFGNYTTTDPIDKLLILPCLDTYYLIYFITGA